MAVITLLKLAGLADDLRTTDIARQTLAQVRQQPSNAAENVGSIAAVPLLRSRGLVDEWAAAYVYREFTCQMLGTEFEAVRAHWDLG